jgi:hypothetical protein
LAGAPKAPLLRIASLCIVAGCGKAPLLRIASLCIVAGCGKAPLLRIASLCIVAGAAPVPNGDVQHHADDDYRRQEGWSCQQDPMMRQVLDVRITQLRSLPGRHCTPQLGTQQPPRRPRHVCAGVHR